MSREGIKRCVGWFGGGNSYCILELYSFHGFQADLWACDHRYFFPPTLQSFQTLSICLKCYQQTWLVWLGWLGIIQQRKGHRFNSQLGHIPGLQLQVWFPLQVQTRGNWSMFLSHIISLPLFFPPFPSKNKKIKSFFFKVKCYQGPLRAKHLLWAFPLSRKTPPFPFTSQLLQMSTYRPLSRAQLPGTPRCQLRSPALFSIHMQASPHHAPEPQVVKISPLDLETVEKESARAQAWELHGLKVNPCFPTLLILSVPQFPALSSDNNHT